MLDEKVHAREVEDVMAVTADECGLPLRAMRSSIRTKHYAAARHAAMYVAYEHLGYSLATIGEIMGHRDHTTVLHGVRKIRHELEYSWPVKNLVEIIKQRLEAGDIPGGRDKDDGA